MSTLENRLKLSNAVIIIWMLGLFLSFGVFSNFIDGESLTHNLFQGIFISLFTGGVLRSDGFDSATKASYVKGSALVKWQFKILSTLEAKQKHCAAGSGTIEVSQTVNW